MIESWIQLLYFRLLPRDLLYIDLPLRDEVDDTLRGFLLVMALSLPRCLRSVAPPLHERPKTEDRLCCPVFRRATSPVSLLSWYLLYKARPSKNVSTTM